MRRIAPSLAAVVTVTLLALTVQQATANQLLLSQTTFRITWPELSMGTNSFGAVSCPATLEGAFHINMISKVGATLVGLVTSAAVGACNGGTAAFLTPPWHLQYESYGGTLPNISNVGLRVVGMSVSGSLFGISCLYRSTAAYPVRLTLNLTGGTVSSVTADGRASIPLAQPNGFCPTLGYLSGSGGMTAPNSPTPIRISLLGTPAPRPRMVALGDSFISGEAGRWAGATVTLGSTAIDALRNPAYWDEPNRLAETIPLCHRSLSWEGGIAVNGSPTATNLACSGATRRTYTEGTTYKPGIDLEVINGRRGQALMLLELAFQNPGSIRLVALSIGGNEFGFADLLTRCISAFTRDVNCKDEAAARQLIEPARVMANTETIRAAILEVRRAMSTAGYLDSSYRILVQDYPSLLPTAGLMRYASKQDRETRGACPFRDADVDWVNTDVLPAIDGAVWSAVAGAGLTNVLRLELRSVLDGRRLCESTVGLLEERGLSSWSASGASDLTEWVRPLTPPFGGFFIQESFHPNYWAQLALRRCLRLAYNSGTPMGGTCTRERNGLSREGEPLMRLVP